MSLDLLERRLDAAREAAHPRRLGTVAQLLGLHLVVRGLDAAVGDVVEVLGRAPGDAHVFAEVAASGPEGLVCLPMADTTGLPFRPSTLQSSATPSGESCRKITSSTL